MGKKRQGEHQGNEGASSKLKMAKSAENDEQQDANLPQMLPTNKFKERFIDSTANSTTMTMSQFEELEHTISNLGFYLQRLVQKFQSLKNVDLEKVENSPDAGEMALIAAKPRVKLAKLIVDAYWKGDLPLIDDILYTRQPSEQLVDIPLLRAFELRTRSIDKIQSAVVQQVQKALKQCERRTHSTDLTKMKSSYKALKRQVRNGASSESTSDDADGDDKDNENGGDPSQWPPQLPAIRDKALLKQVFTHKSGVPVVPGTSKKDLQLQHNERLEFKGDVILDFVVAEMLYDAMPEADEGALTRAKSSLVCNDTLWDLAVAYELPSRIHATGDAIQAAIDATAVHHGKEKKSKLIADMFEAYIGGLSIDRGYGVVQDWLLRLFKPLVEDLRDSSSKSVDVDKNAKAELYRKIGSAEQHITYSHTQLPDGAFRVECSIGGEVLGSGTDRSIKLAGNRAALQVLSNPTLVEKYAQIRRDTVRTAPVTGSLL